MCIVHCLCSVPENRLSRMMILHWSLYQRLLIGQGSGKGQHQEANTSTVPLSNKLILQYSTY